VRDSRLTRTGFFPRFFWFKKGYISVPGWGGEVSSKVKMQGPASFLKILVYSHIFFVCFAEGGGGGGGGGG